MKSIKRFDDQPYLKDCKSRIIQERSRHDGKVEVILEETVFYPTGGGQPHDSGWINGIEVIDVYKEEDQIVHVLMADLNGAIEVECRIDWERRFDHMQQHAGQHILSRAFEDLYQAETVGFHLGEEIVTIDITIPTLSDEMVRMVEEQSNRIILENRKITREWIAAEDVSETIKSKIPRLEESVRIVDIEGFDRCACAGTHPETTAEIGLIKLLNWEKYKQNNIRVYFVCGYRAVKVFSQYQSQLMKTAQQLKTNWMDTEKSVLRLLAEKEKCEQEKKELKFKSIQQEIEEWKNKAEFYSDFHVVEAVFEERDPQEIKQIALGITQSPSYVVLLTNVTKGNVQFLLQRSDDVPLPMNECLKAGLEEIFGKGGGNAKTAQGGGALIEKMDSALEKIRNKMKRGE